MWERLSILAAFVVFVIVARWASRMFLTLIPKERHDQSPARLTPQAAASDPLRAVRRPRSLPALRTSARVVALRGVRERESRLVDRIERRRIERWCLGTPNLDPAIGLDQCSAAERLKQHAQMCEPRDVA